MPYINDNGYPGVVPEIILSHWSKIVKNDFEVANTDIVKVNADGSRAVYTLNQQSQMLQTMHAKIDVMAWLWS